MIVNNHLNDKRLDVIVKPVKLPDVYRDGVHSISEPDTSGGGAVIGAMASTHLQMR
jgi:hypothetical protein